MDQGHGVSGTPSTPPIQTDFSGVNMQGVNIN